MRSFKRIAAVVMAAGITVAGSLTAASPAQAATEQGCPEGYVCIYSNSADSNHRPALRFARYGYHNLSNQFGVKKIVNNQTGAALAKLCIGRNGVLCPELVPPYATKFVDLTYINSIVLF